MTRFPIINWWISRKLDHLHLFLAVCGSMACLVGTFGGFPGVTRWSACFLTVLAAVHLVHYHLHRFWRYLQDYQECDRIPVERMKGVCACLMGGFLLAFLIFLSVGRQIPWKEAGAFLGSLVLAGIRRLVRLIPRSEGEPMGEIPQGGGFAGMPELPAGTASPIALFLERMFSAAVWAALVLLLLRFFVRGLQKLMESIGKVHLAEDEMVFLKPESIREKVERKRSAWGRHVPGFERTSEGRIRRMYRKCIQDRIGRRNKPVSSMTPEQLELAAGIRKTEAASEESAGFHELYEKARYSREGCSRQEEQQMREYCRRLEQESHGF